MLIKQLTYTQFGARSWYAVCGKLFGSWKLDMEHVFIERLFALIFSVGFGIIVALNKLSNEYWR